MWALLALLVLATACEKMTMPSAPMLTQPISTPDPTFSSTRGEAPAFPAVSRPARIYVADDSPYDPMHGSPLASRYVLYDDGTFALVGYTETMHEAHFLDGVFIRAR